MGPQVHCERDAERGHRCFFTCLSGAFPEFIKWGGTALTDIQAYMQSSYFILSMSSSSFCFLLLFCCHFLSYVAFFVICPVYFHATYIEYNHRLPLFADHRLLFVVQCSLYSFFASGCFIAFTCCLLLIWIVC